MSIAQLDARADVGPSADHESNLLARLDAMPRLGLVGLEYIVELPKNIDPTHNRPELYYYCRLCSFLCEPWFVMYHIIDGEHRRLFLQTHFPAIHQNISGYLDACSPRHINAILQEICEHLDRCFDRMPITTIVEEYFDCIPEEAAGDEIVHWKEDALQPAWVGRHRLILKMIAGETTTTYGMCPDIGHLALSAELLRARQSSVRQPLPLARRRSMIELGTVGDRRDQPTPLDVVDFNAEPPPVELLFDESSIADCFRQMFQRSLFQRFRMWNITWSMRLKDSHTAELERMCSLVAAHLLSGGDEHVILELGDAPSHHHIRRGPRTPPSPAASSDSPSPAAMMGSLRVAAWAAYNDRTPSPCDKAMAATEKAPPTKPKKKKKRKHRQFYRR